jgi:hypothetical protein
MATDVSKEEWNQPRCWSEPSRYITVADPFTPELGACIEHAEMGHAGVEPDVENVVTLS